MTSSEYMAVGLADDSNVWTNLFGVAPWLLLSLVSNELYHVIIMARLNIV
jgi:hypothetical protein